MPARPARRRGPQGACSDAELLTRIEAVIEASPFNGEGYRKVWARLRAHGVRTAARRVRRIMRENSLLAPQRPVDREEHPHDGTIMTDRVPSVPMMMRHRPAGSLPLRAEVTASDGYAYFE